MTRPDRARILIYGPSGVGKTTFGSDFHSATGEALSIYAAPEQNHQAVRDRAHLVAKNLDELKVIAQTADVSGFDSVVLDDVQSVIEWLIAEAAKKNEKDFDDLKYGRGWGYVRLELFSLLDSLARRAKNFVLISKEQIVTKMEESARVVVAIRPDLAPNVLGPLEGDVDLIGHAQWGPPNPKGQVNEVTFKATKITPAKDRWGVMGQVAIPLDGRRAYDQFYNSAWTPRTPNQEAK